MKSYKLILAAALFAVTASAQVKVAHFPADMKFLAHIDVKGLYGSKTGDLIKESMDEKSQRKMDSFKALSGVDLMKDLDSVYILGASEGEDPAVIYASGRFDVNKLTTILGGNDSFKSEPFGAHKIISWVDDGKSHYGSFVSDSFVAASDNLENLKKCLSLIDGKGEAISTASPFSAIIPKKANRFVALAAHDVGDMAEAAPQMQMLKQAKSMVLSINQASADKADIMLNAAVSAADLETAQQMGAMIQGIQAMMMMQAAQNPEVAQLAQNFKVETNETKIRMSLKLTEEQLRKQIAEGMKKANQMEAVGDEDVDPFAAPGAAPGADPFAPAPPPPAAVQ